MAYLPGQLNVAQRPNPFGMPQQAPGSSGGWNGGAPLQQPTAPAPGPTGPQRLTAGGLSLQSPGAGAGGGMMTPFTNGGGSALPAAPPRPPMMQPMGGGGGGAPGGTPSWLLPLLAQTPRPAAPAAPADPAPINPQQQMAQNTAMGNNLTAANKLTHLDNDVPNAALYQGGKLVGGSYLNEGVPMAAHLGTARGPLVAGEVGGGGGVNGGGAVGQSLQQSLNDANAANEKRYQQLLTMSGQLSNSAMTRELQNRDNELGRVDQDAIGAGIGNSTVLPSLEGGVYDRSGVRQSEIGDQGLRTAMGIVERRTDLGPDYGAIAGMAARPGASGGGFSGGVLPGSAPTSGAGYGGGGAAGSANLYAMLAALQAKQQAPAPAGDGFTSSNNNGYGHQVPDGYMHQRPDGTWGL